MVYTDRTEQQLYVWIFKTRYKKYSQSFRITFEKSAVSPLFERRTALYKSDHQFFFPPSLISLMVSVDVKHHVYLLTSFFQDFGSSREVLVVSQSHKSSATHSNHYVWYFRVSKHWCGCQCLGFLTCAQMLMHALANGDTARESALNVDSGRIVPCRTEKLNPFSIAPDFYVRHSSN